MKPLKQSVKRSVFQEQTYTHALFKSRELLSGHNRQLRDQKIRQLILDGCLENIVPLSLSGYFSNSLEASSLYHSLLFLVIVEISTAIHAAVEAGMTEDEAYSLGEVYIRQTYAASTISNLQSIHHQMLLDFSQEVHLVRQNPKYSTSIRYAQDYILQHLHCDLTLKEVAEKTGFSEPYFSTLFKKETGLSFREFIHRNRVREAERLLRYSEYSLNEIAQYLGFCSQSHFTEIFRKYNGLSPNRYRKLYFHSHW